MQWWTLKLARAKNVRTRLGALEKLGNEGDLALVEPVAQLLADPEASVRAAAALALARIKRPEALPAITSRLLKDPDAETRRALVKALQEIGNANAVPALVSVLTDPAGEVGWQAARALQALRWEPLSDTERAAWHLAVSQFEDALSYGAAAIEPLTRLTQGIEFHRSIRAVEALAKIGGAAAVKPLLDALAHKDFTVRAAAASGLGELGDARGVDPLIFALRDQHHQVTLAACISLGKMGDHRAVGPLIKILKHTAPDVRTAAVTALGKLRNSEAVPALVELLRDSDLETREAAATALGLIGDEKAIEPLVTSLIDPHQNMRQAAANALRRIEPYWERSEAAFRAIPALQRALKHKEYWVRNAAADALKKLGVTESRDSKVPLDSDGALLSRQAAQAVLKQMLNDRDREFRHAAAEALGRIGLADSIAPLAGRLSDSDSGVRIAAARSLEALRWQPATETEKARQLLALERWTEATALGSEAAEAFGELLNRKEKKIWKRAVEALVQIGGAKSISALRAFAADPAPGGREEALAALAILESSTVLVETPKGWSEVPVLAP